MEEGEEEAEAITSPTLSWARSSMASASAPRCRSASTPIASSVSAISCGGGGGGGGAVVPSPTVASSVQ
eukprot:SAG25_NODE_7288_length_490_cov_1.319693_1_plen_68_part_10